MSRRRRRICFARAATCAGRCWAGCDKCVKTGYKGRTGIHDLLVATPEMKDKIARSATIKEIRELAIHQGMTTQMQDCIWKMLKGQSDVNQLRKVVVE